MPGSYSKQCGRRGPRKWPPTRTWYARTIWSRAGTAPRRYAVRHYRPEGQDHPLPCLYWVHGGGHVMGSIDQDDSWCDHVVATVGCTIVSVEWRQAPEHPYPASLNDCYTGLEWTFQEASALGVDRRRLAVGGASSGGGSAAGVVLLARDRGEIPICLQLLVYPMIDDRNVTLSSQTITDRRVWCREDNLLAWRRYVGDAVGTTSVPVYAAPAGPPSSPVCPARLWRSGTSTCSWTRTSIMRSA